MLFYALRKKLWKFMILCSMGTLPISDFEDLIELQQFKVFIRKVALKGMCWIHWCASWYIKLILPQVSTFSLAFDGSQPWKTCTEKELLYSKYAICGEAVELLLECIHVDDYRGDACDLRRAIDNVILTWYNIPKECYIKLLVCVCTDGASVNMGKYRGNT